MSTSAISVNYKIPENREITAVVGKPFMLTPFTPTGEYVEEIRVHQGEKVLIFTDVQCYTISWWRILEWHKLTTTGG